MGPPGERKVNGRRACTASGQGRRVTSLTAPPAGAADRAGRGWSAGVAVLVLAAFLLVLLLVEQAWHPLAVADAAARDRLHALATAHPAYVLALKAVSTLGTLSVNLVLLTLLVVHLLRHDRLRAAGFAVWTVVGGSVLNTTVKGLVGRARPVLEDPVAHAGASSFPSGHAQGVVVAVGVLLVVLPAVRARRAACWAAGGWVLLMGFSRVGLGVHYASDVLGGYLLGVGWVGACAAVWAPWRTVR